MERYNELGLLSIAPDVVGAIAARAATAQGAIAGLVRRGGSADADVLPRRHRHRAIAIQERDGIWLVSVSALARYGTTCADLEAAANRIAQELVRLLGPETAVQVELRIAGVRRWGGREHMRTQGRAMRREASR